MTESTMASVMMANRMRQVNTNPMILVAEIPCGHQPRDRAPLLSCTGAAGGAHKRWGIYTCRVCRKEICRFVFLFYRKDRKYHEALDFTSSEVNPILVMHDDQRICCSYSKDDNEFFVYLRHRYTLRKDIHNIELQPDYSGLVYQLGKY